MPAGGAATARWDRVHDRVVRLSTAGLPWEDFAADSLELIKTAVPYEAAVMAPFDPQTGLITGSVTRDIPTDSYARFAYFEYTAPDAHSFSQLALRTRPVGVLVDDLHGDPNRAERYRDFYVPTLSLGHEVRVAARARGILWGGISLFRESGTRGFAEVEVDFLAGLIDAIARGFRTGTAIAGASAPPVSAIAPTVLIVDASNTVLASTGEVEAWFAQLDPSGRRPLPISVVSAIVRARITGDAEVTVRTPGFGWVDVRAAVLRGRGAQEGRELAITIERAGSTASAPRIIASLDLARRERQIVDLVLAGRSTVEIARALHLSPYTVQDHLKSVFDKAGVRSRRDLTALLLG